MKNAFTCLCLATVAMAGRDPADGLITAGDGQLRLNHIQTLGTHNSYHVAPRRQILDLLGLLESQVGEHTSPGFDYTHLPITNQLQDLNLRHFELDIFADPKGGLYANRGVLQALAQDSKSGIESLSKPGYKVLHVPDVDFESVCYTLTECLLYMRDWSDGHPGHLPIMVNVEVKETGLPATLQLDFAQPVAADLDALDREVLSVIPANRIITPATILGNASNIRDAVYSTGWPTLAESRGKFLFTLQGEGHLRLRYIRNNPKLAGRVFFPASDPGTPECAFAIFNDPVGQYEAIQNAVKGGLLVRTQADAETVEARNGATTRRDHALSSGAHFVSTDYPTGLPPHLLAPNLSTNYYVHLPPRCNPLFAATTNCQSKDVGQAPVTVPPTLYRPTGTNVNSLTLESLFPGGLQNTNSTRTLLRRWAEIAGIATPDRLHDAKLADQNYKPPVYSPAEHVADMHKFPRVGGVPTDFEPTESYLLGLLWVAVPFAAVGILLGMVSIAFFCKCGCTCRKSGRHHKTHSMAGWRQAFAVLFTLAISGCIVAIVGDVFLYKAIQAANHRLQSVTADLRMLQDFSATFETTLQALSASQADFSGTCPQLGLQSGLEMNDEDQQIVRTIKDLASKTAGFPEHAAQVGGQIDRANTGHTLLVVTVLGLTVLLVAAFAVCLAFAPAFRRMSPKHSLRRAKAVRYCVIPLGIVILCLCLVLAGGLIALNVGAADFCMRPDDVISDQLPADNRDFLQYYLTCNGANQYLDVLAQRGAMLHAANDMAPIVATLAAGMCAAAGKDAVQSKSHALFQALSRVDSSMQTLGSYVSCSYVSAAYSGLVYRTVCSDVTLGLLLLWAGLLLLVVGFVAAMWAYGGMAMTAVLHQWEASNGSMPDANKDETDTDTQLDPQPSVYVNAESFVDRFVPMPGETSQQKKKLANGKDRM